MFFSFPDKKGHSTFVLLFISNIITLCVIFYPMEFINALLTSYLISRSECSMGIWEERGVGCKFRCIIIRCALIVICAFCMLTDFLSIGLFFPERCVLKLSLLSVLLSIFPCISSSFCYIKVVAVLFGTYLSRTIMSTLQIVILAFKMSSLSFLVFCSLTGPQPDIKLITPTFIFLMFAWYTLRFFFSVLWAISIFYPFQLLCTTESWALPCETIWNISLLIG